MLLECLSRLQLEVALLRSRRPRSFQLTVVPDSSQLLDPGHSSFMGTQDAGRPAHLAGLADMRSLWCATDASDMSLTQTAVRAAQGCWQTIASVRSTVWQRWMHARPQA